MQVNLLGEAMLALNTLISSLFESANSVATSASTAVKPSPPSHLRPKTAYNAIWISDLHLGSKDCKAELLLDFLNSSDIKLLYLVGDIIDVWALKKQVFWPDSHNRVLQKLLSLAKAGTKVVYVPGNHDELVKQYHGFHLWDFSVEREYVHTTKLGQRLLIVHGDQFDSQVSVGASLTKLGDKLYDVLLLLNRQLHLIRQRLGYPYWSLASYIKQRVGKAQHAIGLYRQAVVRFGVERGVDGVVCGHIHQPELSLHQGVIYANDGDWVENCTVFAESCSGELQLLRWDEASRATELISSVMLSGQRPQRQVA